MKKSIFYITLIFIISNYTGKAQKISASSEYSLFLNADGTVCVTRDGEYENYETEPTFTPIQVSSLSGITAVSAGGEHSLFLKNNGTVWASGRNYEGQLGEGTTTSKYTPIQVSSLSGITAISASGIFYSDHSLFLKNDGTVWGTGGNEHGQLGDGTITNKSTPIQVSSLSGITAMSAGASYSLFLKNDGTVWGTGDNDYGQLGDGTNTNRLTPIQVSSLSGITAISAGDYHSLFLKNDGTVWGTGDNDYGSLGDGTTTGKSTPVQVSSLSGITAISAGEDYSLFLKEDATVWVTGLNESAQLGDGTNTDKSTPVQALSCTDLSTYSKKIHGSKLDLFPNPVETDLVISVPDYNNSAAEVFDLQGQLLKRVSLKTEKTTINVSGFPSGTYVIIVKSDKNTAVSKFIKK